MIFRQPKNAKVFTFDIFERPKFIFGPKLYLHKNTSFLEIFYHFSILIQDWVQRAKVCLSIFLTEVGSPRDVRQQLSVASIQFS